MSKSVPIRIPIELIEKAEKTALLVANADQKLTSRSEIIKKALEIGLKELEEKNKI